MNLKYANKKLIADILSNTNPGRVKIQLNKSILIQGDNFDVLSSSLDSLSQRIDLVYIDPPFNTNSIFTVSKGRASTISKTADGTVAYFDCMSPEEYLEFLRCRLILIRECLSDQGSIYLHIDYKIGHYVKVIMDEVFGRENFKNDITRIKSNPKNFFRRAYGNEKDLILFYSKNYKKNIWNDVRIAYSKEELQEKFPKIDSSGRRYTTVPMHAPGETKGVTGQPWKGIQVPKGRHWRSSPALFDKMDAEGNIEWSSTGNPRIKKYADDHKGKKIQDVWTFKDPQYPTYPTEKNHEMIERIIRQSSSEDSVVMDCFAGSGSTLVVANQLGRKWIGIDSSPVAIKTVSDNLKNTDYFFLDLS